MFNTLQRFNILLPLNFILFNYLVYFTAKLVTFNYDSPLIIANFISVNSIFCTISFLLILFNFVLFFFSKKNSLKILWSNYIVIFFLGCIIFLLLLVDNLVIFFMLYELLLLASIFLVRFSSPNRRSFIVSQYFLFWTQFGSFLVFLGLVLIVLQTHIWYFSQLDYNPHIGFTISLLLFFGFGVKIPLWPFHFWLTKTHVEANTAFSIYLSGLLVKCALLGLYKFKLFYYLPTDYQFILVACILVSAFDASIKLLQQIDLKKLIAFSTIQEMALLVFILLFKSGAPELVFLLLLGFHTLISGVFFLLNDSIIKRIGHRNLQQLTGLGNLFPKLQIFIFIFLFFFMGVPLTVKYYLEIFLLLKFLITDLYIYIFALLIIQYASIVFFFKQITQTLFGSQTLTNKNDLSYQECLYYCLFLTSFLLLSCY